MLARLLDAFRARLRRSVEQREAAYPHPCKHCDCPAFLGQGTICERQSCLHSWGVHE